MIKIIPNKFQTSPKKTQLEEQRKLGHNLSLEICKSLHYSVLARETNGLGEGPALTVPAESNFLSFNEGWRAGLIKLRSLQVCVCVCVSPRQTERERERERVCVCVCARARMKRWSPQLNLLGQVRVAKSNLILSGIHLDSTEQRID